MKHTPIILRACALFLTASMVLAAFTACGKPATDEPADTTAEVITTAEAETTEAVTDALTTDAEVPETETVAETQTEAAPETEAATEAETTEEAKKAPQTKDGKIQTSKDDVKNHGFGIQNIESAAEGYGGELNVTFEEKPFGFTCRAEIIIPIAD